LKKKLRVSSCDFVDRFSKTFWVLLIILFMAVKFLKRLIDGKSAIDTLYVGLAVAVVAGVLILFNRVSTEKE